MSHDLEVDSLLHDYTNYFCLLLVVCFVSIWRDKVTPKACNQLHEYFRSSLVRIWCFLSCHLILRHISVILMPRAYWLHKFEGFVLSFRIVTMLDQNLWAITVLWMVCVCEEKFLTNFYMPTILAISAKRSDKQGLRKKSATAYRQWQK